MTDDSEEWGPWIEHDGKGCPVPSGTVVEITEKANVDGDGFQIGDERTGVVIASDFLTEPWYRGKAIADIIRYRIRKPRAMRQLIEMVENLPAPSKQGERVR